VIAIASLMGFVGAEYRTQAVPVVDAATVEQQRFVANLRPIRGEIQQNAAREGLLIAAYEGHEIDGVSLQRQLGEVLAGYQAVADELNALDTPAQQRATTQSYAQTIGMLSRSVTELSKAYDDGDRKHASAALGVSLEAVARLHAPDDR